MKGQMVDEFAVILIGGLVLIGILAMTWMSEVKLTVVPDSRQLTIARGSSLSFPIYLNGTAKNITLKSSGEIANWISFDRSNLDVYDKEQVNAMINVPPSASYGTHTGDIYVQAFGFEKRISVIVNVSKVTVSGQSRSINLGDFTVAYTVGPETVRELGSLKVERGYFTDFPVSFAAILSEEKAAIVTGGYIQIVVDQTNSIGNLIVEVNGNETYNNRAGVGEVIIPLSKDQIKKSNSVVLRAGTPGWLFWSSSVYNIGSVKFVAEYNGTVFKEINFDLDNLEVVNFQSGRLSFTVNKYDVSKLNDLTVKINNQVIFDGVPTLVYFTKTFGNEVSLNIGTNTISFSVEPDTFYELKDVTLTITRSI
jgi:hypothetical protein